MRLDQVGNPHSHGLDQFCSSLEERPGLTLFSIWPAPTRAPSASSPIYGHRLYSDDFLHADGPLFRRRRFLRKPVESAEGGPVPGYRAGLSGPAFRRRAGVGYAPVLQRPLLRDRGPAAAATCCGPAVTCWRYFTPRNASRPSRRIPTASRDRKTITLAPRGRRRPAQFFNNRSLEKLFQDFESVKFFLTRDHLREVIVRR